jgi:hypothetical protein
MRDINLNVDESDKKCAPHLKFDSHCAPLDVIIELAKSYNEEIESSLKGGKESIDKDSIKNKIILNEKYDTLNPGKYKQYLVKELHERLYDVCDMNQKCWIKQSFVERMNKELKDYLKKKTYRPYGPSEGTKWLNTLNINNAMIQYEDKFKDFIFMGAVPLDFNKLDGLTVANGSMNVAKVDFNKLEQMGKKKIGFVINLDTHDQPGSHWVALYSNLEKGITYFYDSYGSRPPAMTRDYMRDIDRYFIHTKKMKHSISDYNKKRHQRKNSECGVYSMAFIIGMLNADASDDENGIIKEFERVNNEEFKDDDVQKCRNVYFTNEKNKKFI